MPGEGPGAALSSQARDLLIDLKNLKRDSDSVAAAVRSGEP